MRSRGLPLAGSPLARRPPRCHLESLRRLGRPHAPTRPGRIPALPACGAPASRLASL